MKIEYLAVLLGVVGALLYSTPLQQTSVLSEELIGKTVVLSGVASNPRYHNGITFFEVNENKVVFFKPVHVLPGEFVRVKGKVKKYMNRLELVGESVD